MRLEGQKKLGFYPAHPLVISELVKHLTTRGPDPTKKFDTINILDPCCGQGSAIKQIADGLDIEYDHVYTCELDPERGKAAAELIPGGHHISPATFLGCQVTGYSFGLIYCNPPFDDELGGGRREEMAFIQAATPLLAVHGVLALVCPLASLAGRDKMIQYIDAYYEDIRVYKFPDGHDEWGKDLRRYHEVVLLGRKRKEIIPLDAVHELGGLHTMGFRWNSYYMMDTLAPLGTAQPEAWIRGNPSRIREPDIRVWEIPHSWRPNTYKKHTYTEAELDEVLDNSPLRKHFAESPPTQIAQPPLALDRGHLGLILASGMLDGRVEGPYGVHVVRGSSYKKQYRDEEASESNANPETGAVTTKETYRERMITCIRCVTDWPTPAFHTLTNDVKEEKEEHEEAKGDD